MRVAWWYWKNKVIRYNFKLPKQRNIKIPPSIKMRVIITLFLYLTIRKQYVWLGGTGKKASACEEGVSTEQNKKIINKITRGLK